VLVGCDSDAGGALAIVRGPSVGVVASVEVIDCPTVKVEVNGKLRTRLHAEAMVAALASLRLPPGQVAHLEEGGVEYGFSAQTAFVQGYNFGLWRGVLASAGLEVRIVKPQAWKWALGLAHRGAKGDKDASRAMAESMFPELAPGTLRRKKDHGRAEALLIAAYGHVAETARGERDGIRDHRERSSSSAEEAEEGGEGEKDVEGEGGSAAARGADGEGEGARGRRSAAEADPLAARVRDMVVRAAEERAAEEAEAGGGGAGGAGGAAERNVAAAIGPDDPLPYFGPYFGMTGKQLAGEARSRGLKVGGKKMELVARLEADDAARSAERGDAGERAEASEASAR